MSLNGVEVAAKISGKAAERLAVLLYAVLRDQKKTRGKIRLTNMLKSGKELKVFAVRDGELRKFCEEAKKYGVLYCVLKDNNAADGLTDIMVRAEDAGKINRIFERFGLATVDMASVKTEIQQSREDKVKGGEEIPTPERTQTNDNKLNQFLEAVAAEQPNPTAEPTENTNPTTARTAKSRPSERSSGSRDSRGGVGGSERDSRHSVREELREIRREQRQKLPEADRENLHIPVRVKKSDKEAVQARHRCLPTRIRRRSRAHRRNRRKSPCRATSR